MWFRATKSIGCSIDFWAPALFFFFFVLLNPLGILVYLFQEWSTHTTAAKLPWLETSAFKFNFSSSSRLMFSYWAYKEKQFTDFSRFRWFFFFFSYKTICHIVTAFFFFFYCTITLKNFAHPKWQLLNLSYFICTSYCLLFVRARSFSSY